MKKNSLNLGVDGMLFGLLLVVASSGLLEHHPPPSLHGVLGMTLAAGSLVHLALHRRWVQNVLRKYKRLPKTTRSNLHLATLLLGGYLVCAYTGWMAAHISGGLFQQFLTLLHQVTALTVIAIQSIHIARHWKWIRIAFSRTFARAGRQHRAS